MLNRTKKMTGQVKQNQKESKSHVQIYLFTLKKNNLYSYKKLQNLQ